MEAKSGISLGQGPLRPYFEVAMCRLQALHPLQIAHQQRLHRSAQPQLIGALHFQHLVQRSCSSWSTSFGYNPSSTLESVRPARSLLRDGARALPRIVFVFRRLVRPVLSVRETWSIGCS